MQSNNVHPDALELAELLRPTWPAFSARLRERPTLIAEGDGGDGGDGGSGDGGEGGSSGAGGSGSGSGSQGESKPPWGSDDEFDPARAWKLITDLRGDLDKIKGDRDELRTKVQQHERANETAQEKAAREKEEADKRAATAEATALRLEVALDKAPEGMQIGQIRKLAKRLSGNTREELEADADELFADFAPGEGDGDGQEPRRRPRERMRSGNAPSSEPEETDPEKLAAQVPRMY